MRREKSRDVGALVAQQLGEIRRVFEQADLVYREFRIRVLEDPPEPEFHIPEWIPISDH